jgi:hypothetical protein
MHGVQRPAEDAQIAGPRPQGSRSSEDDQRPCRRRLSGHLLQGVAQQSAGRDRSGLRHAVDDLRPGRGHGQTQDREDHQQQGEQGQDRVIGQRSGPVRDVVVPDGHRRPAQRRPPPSRVTVCIIHDADALTPVLGPLPPAQRCDTTRPRVSPTAPSACCSRHSGPHCTHARHAFRAAALAGGRSQGATVPCLSQPPCGEQSRRHVAVSAGDLRVRVWWRPGRRPWTGNRRRGGGEKVDEQLRRDSVPACSALGGPSNGASPESRRAGPFRILGGECRFSAWGRKTCTNPLSQPSPSGPAPAPPATAPYPFP